MYLRLVYLKETCKYTEKYTSLFIEKKNLTLLSYKFIRNAVYAVFPSTRKSTIVYVSVYHYKNVYF